MNEHEHIHEHSHEHDHEYIHSHEHDHGHMHSHEHPHTHSHDSINNHEQTHEHSHDHGHEHSHGHGDGHCHESSENHTHNEGVSHTHILEDGTIITHVHHSQIANPTNNKAISNRLAKAIGHLEAVKRMVEDGKDVAEILIQLAAVKSAINNTGKVLLKEYIENCVVDAVEHGDQQALSDLASAVDKFVK